LIFVSLGTHEQPFERAIDLVEPLAPGHVVVVQHGHTPPRYDRAGMVWNRFVAYEQVVELMLEADAVVCHAGVGTVMTALGLGRTPVVVPRLARLGEHVDDHQLQITAALVERGLAVPVYEGGDMRAALREAARQRSGTLAVSGDLREAVRLAAMGAAA
jgi:UDP-N-acetylglucosamine transferase subunit ALG13